MIQLIVFFLGQTAAPRWPKAGRLVRSLMSCASDLRPGNTYASDLQQRVLRNTRPAASVRLSRAPHFSGGDEHPAALGQAVFFSGGVEQPAAQHVLHQNQAVPQSITCVRACLRECMCSHTQRRSFSCHFQTNVISWFSWDKRE